MSDDLLSIHNQIKIAERDKLIAERERIILERKKIDLECEEAIRKSKWGVISKFFQILFSAGAAATGLAFYINYVVIPTANYENYQAKLENAKANYENYIQARRNDSITKKISEWIVISDSISLVVRSDKLVFDSLYKIRAGLLSKIQSLSRTAATQSVSVTARNNQVTALKNLAEAVVKIDSSLSSVTAKQISVKPVSLFSVEAKTSIVDELLLLTNNYRKSQNLKPLQINGVVSQAATNHSRNMADGLIMFGHDGFTERIKLISKILGKNIVLAAENVANGKLSAKDVSDLWLKSPGHRKNILGNYNQIGIGISERKDGTIYFTEIFVSIK